MSELDTDKREIKLLDHKRLARLSKLFAIVYHLAIGDKCQLFLHANGQQVNGPKVFSKFKKKQYSRKRHVWWERGFSCYVLNLTQHWHQELLRKLGIQASPSGLVKVDFTWRKSSDILARRKTTLANLWHRTANKLPNTKFWLFMNCPSILA